MTPPEGDDHESETVEEALWRLDQDIDKLFDMVADLTANLKQLRTPTRLQLPPNRWRMPLHKSIASLDKQLAGGIIDQDEYDRCVDTLTRADQFWTEHPDGHQLVIDMEHLWEEVEAKRARAARAHLHTVPDQTDSGPG